MKISFFVFLLASSLVACGGGSHKKMQAIATSSVASSSSSSSLPSSSSSSQIASASSSSVASVIPFTLVSSSFLNDSDIPIKYSCFSTQVSPQLAWTITSDQVKSFALVMEDIDAIAIVGYPYVHWNVFNIPAATREIVEGATLHAMPLGSIEGTNADGVPSYAGPCPPDTGTHHYYFALYALNVETLPVDTSKAIQRSQFEAKYSTNIVAKAEVMGRFKH